jgi:hypothetical protein
MNNSSSLRTSPIRDLLVRIENWDQFEKHAASLGNTEKGRLFEHLVKHYLELDPKYQSKLEKVWLFADIRRRERDHRIYLEAQMHTIGTKDGRITRTGWGWSEAKVSPFAAAALLPSATNHRAEVGDEEAQPIIPPDLAHKAAQGW